MDGIETTRDMEKHKAIANPINYKSEKVPEAYGELIYDKIVAALKNEDTQVRIEALDQLTDLVWDDNNVSYAIDYGVFSACVSRLSDDDAGVRQRASGALINITRPRVGRDHAITFDISAQLKTVITDSDETVRLNVYSVLQNIAKDPAGMALIIKAELPELFIKRIGIEESSQLKSAAILIVTKCCGDPIGYDVCMSFRLVDSIKAALDKCHNDATMTACCSCMAAVAYNFDGQDACVNVGAVPLILNGLQTPNSNVQSAAASALMNITICYQGKVKVIENNGLAKLMACATHHESRVVAPCLQAIASTVEHPDAKLDPSVVDQANRAFINALCDSKDPLIARSAKLAKKRIEHKA